MLPHGAERYHDTGIDQTLQRIRQGLRNMANNNNNPNQQPVDERNVAEPHYDRPLCDYVRPQITGSYSSIRKPAIQANHFELKPAMIRMIQTSVQFSGLPSEDANAHIAEFLELCDTFKHDDVSDDAVRLRLFPFSLRDRAKQWLNSLPLDSIETWNDLTEKFLTKYFSPSKTAKLRIEIHNFTQLETESLYDAYERR